MIQVIDSIPWVRCASGNVCYTNLLALVPWLVFWQIWISECPNMTGDMTQNWITQYCNMTLNDSNYFHVSQKTELNLPELFVIKRVKGFLPGWLVGTPNSPDNITLGESLSTHYYRNCMQSELKCIEKYSTAKTWIALYLCTSLHCVTFSVGSRVSQKNFFLNFVSAVEPLVRNSSQSPRKKIQRYRPINDTVLRVVSKLNTATLLQ